jgi:D-alanyl-lipoteichoic acid acyltransferase DltB (MBOAT superfamily)
MAFTSPTFLLFVLIVVLLVNAAPSARAWLLLGANVVFLASHVSRANELVPLLAFIALGYVLVEALRRTRSTSLLWAGLASVVVGFVWLKKYAFVPDSLGLPMVYAVVGLSYVLFRVVHLMIDAKQGELGARISPLSFFNYTASFLTLTAGPIQRYPEFSRAQAESKALDEAGVFSCVSRIITGFIRVSVVSAVFNYLFATVSSRLLDPHVTLSWSGRLGAYSASSLFYTVFLYANFAGYMDIVIGVGGLLGQELPENFDRPFRARNFLELWTRWHITLSQWFRTYVFNPLLQVLAARVTSAKLAPYLAVVAFFVTFLLMGIWHGATSVFVLYGLFMGAGASVNKLWQLLAIKRFGKAKYKAWCEKPPIAYLARGLTFSYFAFGLSCLWLNLSELLGIASRLGPSGILLGYLGLSIGAALALLALDLLSAGLARLKRTAWNEPGLVVRNLGLGLQILLIFSVSSFFHKAPEFVYRAF